MQATQSTVTGAVWLGKARESSWGGEPSSCLCVLGVDDHKTLKNDKYVNPPPKVLGSIISHIKSESTHSQNYLFSDET